MQINFMKKFKWLLNHSLNKQVQLPNNPIPVYKGGRIIGNCKVTSNGNQIIGEFSLSENLDDTDYILYTLSSLGNSTLVGISIMGYDASIENVAMRASNMTQA